MTDKVQKIREEVERLYNQSLADENRQTERGLERAANVSYGKSKACNELISFIDSLQEEPVSIDFEQELYKAFGQVKDFTLGMQIAKWFYEMGKNSQEPVSEELIIELKSIINIRELAHQGVPVVKIARHFADWQKQQMMAKAVDGEVTYGKSLAIPSLGYFLDKNGLDFGDKVKVIIIKED